MLKEKFMELANDLRNEGLNFALILEKDNEVYSQHSIRGGSKLNEIKKDVKDLIKADNKK